MKLSELNRKIESLPLWDRNYAKPNPPLDRELARYLRDERFGLLGVKAGDEPTEEQCKIVFKQLFPEELI